MKNQEKKKTIGRTYKDRLEPIERNHHQCKYDKCKQPLLPKDGTFCDATCHKKWFESAQAQLEKDLNKGTYVRIDAKTVVLVKPGKSQKEVVAKVKAQLGTDLGWQDKFSKARLSTGLYSMLIKNHSLK